jgi:nucleoid DNA-binding protein
MRKAVVRKGTDEDTQFFINQIKEQTGLSDVDAERAVDVLISTIPRGLKNADAIEVPGVGVFSTEYKSGQQGPGSEHYRIVKYDPAEQLKGVAATCRTQID